VSACGTALCLDGRAWYLYGASQLGGLDDPDGRADLAVAARLNTLRIVNFLDEHANPDSAPYDAWRWQRVDKVIAAAGARGLKVILDLSTYRNLLWNAGRNPYTTDWGTFITFATQRLNTVTGVRYADDPTIAIVAFAGEVEPINTGDNTRGITTQQVTDFFRRSFGQWKALDGHHLLSTGGLLQLDWASGIDWKALFVLPGSDVCSIHDYSVKDQQITTPLVASYCRTIGRPWITEEFGWEQSIGDSTRAQRFSGMYQLQATQGAAGVAFWNLGPQTTGTTYDVNAASTLTGTWNAVRNAAP
jgi:hypothetical protein